MQLRRLSLAEENSRDSIYEVMRRKEIWGTGGPRIKVRIFGGFDLDNVLPGENDWVDAACKPGVSMRG